MKNNFKTNFCELLKNNEPWFDLYLSNQINSKIQDILIYCGIECPAIYYYVVPDNFKTITVHYLNSEFDDIHRTKATINFPFEWLDMTEEELKVEIQKNKTNNRIVSKGQYNEVIR